MCRKFIKPSATVDDALDGFYCIGYIFGLVDGSVLGSRGEQQRFVACIPAEAPIGELVKVVVKYGDDHPENLHKHSILFLKDALQHGFPCS